MLTMMRFLKLLVLILGLIAVALISAVGAMRFAIHGSEVRIPKLLGLTPAEAERTGISQGLVVVVETKFYSTEVPGGRIVSQMPDPGAKVRRGWRVRVAESLGPPHALIPTVAGQSARVAEINIRRRGLEVGGEAIAHLSNASPDQVIGQNPTARAEDISAPKVDLLISAAPAPVQFVMPSFVGSTLGDAAAKVLAAGMRLGRIEIARSPTSATTPAPPLPGASPKGAQTSIVPLGSSGSNPGVLALPPSITPENTPLAVVTRQYPSAGQRVSSEAVVAFEVTR